MTRAARALALAALACLVSAAAGALEVPYLAGRVNDLAGLLSGESAARLEESLAELERQTGAQVAVLTLPSLEGENLEEFSLRVAETWGLGREEVDDGALLLIARDDRKMRLEVGYGLEGKIPDVLAGRILDQVLRPRFREGRFDEGIEEGVKAVAGLIRGEAEALPVAAVGEPTRPATGGFERIFLIGFFLLTVGQFSLRALLAKGWQGWFLYVFLIPFWVAFPMAFFGGRQALALGAAWTLGAPPLRLLLSRTAPGRWLSESSWVGRSFTGSGWSSGGWSSGGGSFSGGGGSFGGGGSSSSW